MIKLLIVEDEMIELNALHSIIINNRPEVDDIKLANTGEDCIALLELYEPDIVFMDINLGSCDGMEISKMIMQRNPNAKIIMITAYNAFHYAQKALTIGVFEYLLKPISTPQLLTVLDRAILEIMEHRNAIISQTRMVNRYEELKDIFFNTILNKIVMNDIPEYSINFLKKFSIPTDFISLLTIEINVNETELLQEELLIIKKIFLQDFKNKFTSQNYIIDINSKEHIIISMHSNDMHNDNLTIFINSIEYLLKDTYNIQYKIGVSEVCEKFTDIYNYYKQAVYALKTGKDPVNFYDKRYELVSFVFDVNTSIKIISECVLEVDENKLTNELCHIKKYIHNSQNFNEARLNMIFLWLGVLNYLSLEKIQDLSPNTFVENLLKSQTESEIYKILEKAMEILLNLIKDRIAEKDAYFAKRAKKYIENNYTAQLTLQTISSALNINHYYLCHLFKDYFQTGVIEYLRQYRIEISKELLKDREKSIKDITQEVGFSDPNYFCRVFKKIVGCSPSNFKNMQTDL